MYLNELIRKKFVRGTVKPQYMIPILRIDFEVIFECFFTFLDLICSGSPEKKNPMPSRKQLLRTRKVF